MSGVHDIRATWCSLCFRPCVYAYDRPKDGLPFPKCCSRVMEEWPELEALIRLEGELNFWRTPATEAFVEARRYKEMYEDPNE